MAWTHYQTSLAILFVITGSFNTLSVKYADKQIVPGIDGQPRYFNHPFMQSSFMFLGEMLCLLVFKIAYCYYERRGDGTIDETNLTKGLRTFNPFVLFVPALCDMFATSIMYIGLNMTYASSFQMLRGASIIFTGILSVSFLERKLKYREWSGIVMVTLGLALVGISDFVTKETDDTDSNSIIAGDLLIVCAQVITATQMVVEEKYVSGQDIPALQAVGWEGVFGFIGMCLAMIPLNYISAQPPFADNSRGTLEATVDAFVQIGKSGRLFTALIGIVVSIAFFNFSGISITKEMSATTRMVLDSARTIIIWAISLTLRWQKFHYLQLVGFAILLLGMCFYNDIFIAQFWRKCCGRLTRHRPLPPGTEIIHTLADDDTGA
ncbi:solute carrier family 35 member F6 [Orussus abietinus]|uniref:solute carrier family 35 member F6 n=1 Tax=Orussus abietinus TaxID=222816 RepID=UPI000625627F|nr:solute carrier family 35 member F6 [Orussus abietinus]XP_012273942.1 solute carrier family 35 member F6 [Orussus abietinus]XP_012273943.1 solute carrier family 35 member F6 [Orussus abietinus]